MIYENNVLKRILVDGGYYENGTYYFYLTDHLGNNRVVANQSGTVIQSTQYYPFGMDFADGTNPSTQPYKFGGKELDSDRGLNLYDFHARWQDAVLGGRFLSVDPLAEKYYWISPYVYCMNNPVNAVDLRGDSLTLVGDNLQEILNTMYHGFENETNVHMKFNNGVLDPSSIAEQAKNSSDLFLQDLYEIAVNPIMAELSISDKNRFNMNGEYYRENFPPPYDYDTRQDPQAEAIAKEWGQPIGKTIIGNLDQTLISGNIAPSGKSSTNNNVQIIINGRGSLNHRTVGLAHEFGHVILYMRGLPFGHGQPGVDSFIYDRSTKMSKKLGYDF